MKRVISFLLTLAMVFSMLPVAAFATEQETIEAEEILSVQEEPVSSETEETVPAAPEETEATEPVPVQLQTLVETYQPASGDADNDALLEGYLYQSFYGGISLFGVAAYAQLDEYGQFIYSEMKSSIEAIAAGNRISSVITLDLTGMNFSGTSLEVLFEELHLDKVLDALLHDCPYELYWYDKTGVTRYSGSGYGIDDEVCLTEIVVTMPVTADLRGDGYTDEAPVVNVGGVNTSAAVAEARTIVEAAAGMPVYEKLDYFKDHTDF